VRCRHSRFVPGSLLAVALAVGAAALSAGTAYAAGTPTSPPAAPSDLNSLLQSVQV
jgi:hypothetical protein